MNKKIKLIELLNKIANGEDLPKIIKIQDYVFKLSKDYEHYYYNEDVEITHLINHNFSNLNDEVEILEDNTEEIDIQELKKYEFPGYVDIKLSPIEKKLLELINQNRQAVKKLDKDINYIDN